jgi:hypothetical protein
MRDGGWTDACTDIQYTDTHIYISPLYIICIHKSTCLEEHGVVDVQPRQRVEGRGREEDLVAALQVGLILPGF